MNKENLLAILKRMVLVFILLVLGYFIVKLIFKGAIIGLSHVSEEIIGGIAMLLVADLLLLKGAIIRFICLILLVIITFIKNILVFIFTGGKGNGKA